MLWLLFFCEKRGETANTTFFIFSACSISLRVRVATQNSLEPTC